MFPFTYEGVTYSHCTLRHDSQAWCSTRTDQDGNHISSEWGYCTQTCLTGSTAHTLDVSTLTDHMTDYSSSTVTSTVTVIASTGSDETSPTTVDVDEESATGSTTADNTSPQTDTTFVDNTSPPRDTTIVDDNQGIAQKIMVEIVYFPILTSCL